MKLILEHQQDLDRKDGIEQEHSAYTMVGILKLMREDRRIRKEEKREARQLAREIGKNSQAMENPNLSVKRFGK